MRKKIEDKLYNLLRLHHESEGVRLVPFSHIGLRSRFDQFTTKFQPIYDPNLTDFTLFLDQLSTIRKIVQKLFLIIIRFALIKITTEYFKKFSCSKWTEFLRED